jgi:hypothetical protein
VDLSLPAHIVRDSRLLRITEPDGGLTYSYQTLPNIASSIPTCYYLSERDSGAHPLRLSEAL